MGTSASKNNSRQDDGNAFLSRSRSVPASSYGLGGEQPGRMSWKSRLSSIPRPGIGAKHLSKVVTRSSTLRSVKEEEPDLMWDEDKLEATSRKEEGGKLNRTVSFRFAQKPDAEPKFALSRKSFKEGKLRREGSGSVDSSVRSRKQLSHSVSEPRRSFSRDFDMSIGLRVLLNPALAPSHSFASPKRGASFSKMPSLKGDVDFRLDHGSEKPFASSKQPVMHRGSDADEVAAGELWSERGETQSPLFDPSLLATFEKAVEALSDDGWQTSDFSASEMVSSSSETGSDADSPKIPASTDVFLERSQHATDRKVFTKKPSFSKVFSVLNNGKQCSRQEYLDKFERRCPDGCENKIVLYFTSLRGVRKTFEDCCTLRLILKGFRVHVDERDVWMHSGFREELTDVMGAGVSVPRLFILGRYIGGAEEVELLHEEGVLRKLLEGLPTEWRQVCDICGDVRFIPCTSCSGSCKLMCDDGSVKRCSDCNENGLIMCPMCAW